MIHIMSYSVYLRKAKNKWTTKTFDVKFVHTLEELEKQQNYIMKRYLKRRFKKHGIPKPDPNIDEKKYPFCQCWADYRTVPDADFFDYVNKESIPLTPRMRKLIYKKLEVSNPTILTQIPKL